MRIPLQSCMRFSGKTLALALWIIATVMLSVPASVDANAQNRVDRSFYYDFGEKVYYDILNVSHPSPDSTRFLVLFRLRHDLLTFTKVNGKRSRAGEYLATPVTYVELFDSQGVIRHSSDWRDTIYANDYEATVSKKNYKFGAVECVVPSGTYTITIEVGDERTPRQFRYKIEDAEGINFSSGEHIGNPLFCYGDNELPSGIQPYVLSTQVLFNHDLRVIVPLAGYRENQEFNYAVRRVIKSEREDTPQWFPGVVDITGITQAKRTQGITVSSETSLENVIVRYDRPDDGLSLPSGPNLENPQTMPLSGGLSVLDFEVSGATLAPGVYELEVYPTGGLDTVKTDFKVIWLNQPLSLRNLQYATELTFYLATDEEYDELKSGSKTERLRKFLDFWSKRDPSPGTAYNEAMAEYFARVDYAHFNYRTIKQRDGARSDRGKIFILHGEPSKTDRILDPGSAPREVWTYSNNVAKEFVFESESSGIFSLIEINALE